MEQKINTIDEYILNSDETVQPRLFALKKMINENAPLASERISWGMATFYMDGNLIHFALQKKHIGIYPGAMAVAHFAPILDNLGYKYSKGAIQFPLNKDLPMDLIKDIVCYCVAQRKDEMLKKQK